MKLRSIFWCGVVILALIRDASGQGFVNLDFESANLSPIPPGQYGGLVPFSDALPGWVGYYGTNIATVALQNNETLGSAAIDILGPDSSEWNNLVGQPIDGNYSVILQGQDGPYYSVSIAQTALVPLSTRSLQFKSKSNSKSIAFQVKVGNQVIPMVPILDTTDYTVFAGDVSAFAGQQEELCFASAPNNAPFWVDDITFSTEEVPEPTVLYVLWIGALCFIRYFNQPNTALEPTAGTLSAGALSESGTCKLSGRGSALGR